ncbi:putative ATP-dependent RNA helicase DHX40 [Oculina patagonica]
MFLEITSFLCPLFEISGAPWLQKLFVFYLRLSFSCLLSSSSPPRWCREHYIHWRALKMAYNIHHQLETILQRQLAKGALPKQATENTSANSKDLLRRALCSGYFCNVARKSSTGNSFRTMDGHGTQVYIHPSSTLFGCEDQLEWIIFHDIIWTSKIYVRTVCPIRYDWVRDLLPRLHEVDSYSLSGWAEGKLTDSKHEGSSRDHDQHEADSSTEAAKILKRNTEDSITAARQRFLERKRARDQQQGT